jgi:hypothetical protein
MCGPGMGTRTFPFASNRRVDPAVIRSALKALTLGVFVASLSLACSPSPSPVVSPSLNASDATFPLVTPTGLAGPIVLPRDTAWKLLFDHAGGGPADTIEVLTTTEEFGVSWSRRDLGQPVPNSPFQRPLFVFFSILVSLDCPDAVMDAVGLDPAASLIFGVFTRTTRGSRNCSDVGGAHTFVVVIDRAVLPTGHITIRLERDFRVCGDCGRELEEAEIDL